LTAEQVFTFKARIIDDKPTANGRHYTKEWREANAPKFFGAPIIFKHDISGSSESVGYVYKAEHVDDAILGMVFIPTNTASGAEAVTKVRNGQLKSMSLHAISHNVKSVDGIVQVSPSETDRILEVSFVAVGGCQSCGVVKEDAELSAESEDDLSDSLREFAEQQWKELQAEYVRCAAFALGTGIDRDTYQSVAESVEPSTLKTMVQDLKKTIEDKKQNGEPVELEADEAEVNKLRERLASIRKTKGV
jgi:hypothetical protein